MFCVVADEKKIEVSKISYGKLANIGYEMLPKKDNGNTTEEVVFKNCDKRENDQQKVTFNDELYLVDPLPDNPINETADLPNVPQTISHDMATVEPLAFSWGTIRNLAVRMQVRVENNGLDNSIGLLLHMPKWESQSPYQTMSIGATSHEILEIGDREITFGLGNLVSGDEVIAWVDWHIEVRPFTVISSNTDLDLARQLFKKSSGNCKDAALAYVSRCRDAGLTARYVVGFVSADKGTLSGCRHAWTEVYVQDLGWVMVDTNYGYFAELPAYDMRFIEGYDDISVRLNSIGGEPSIEWINMLL